MDNVRDLTPNDIADIFGTTTGGQQQAIAPAFRGGLDNTVDLLNTLPKQEVEEVTEPKVTEGAADKPDAAIPDPNADADIFTDDPAKKVEKEDKPMEIKGLSDYYQDRLKNGLFVEVEVEDDNGKKSQFIPQTPEEFDEVFQIQLDYKLNEAKKEVEQQWYETKSPAWRAVSQYAEMIDDPSELIPFLQGVKTIQTVSNLNEEEPDQAEQIVRARMEQRGEPDEIIKSQIEALKTTDKLVATAKQVKPIMIRQEQEELAKQVQRAKQQEQEYIQTINDIRENAHKAIEQPIFGKQKLKQEEKAIIYDLIAVPSEQTQGYGIYSVIDKLFDNRDFETLKMLALLAAKKDAFLQYMGVDVANKTAQSLHKKLTVAGERGTASGNDMGIEERPVVNRNQFSKTPRFGK